MTVPSFASPWFLLAAVVAVPLVIWLSRRSLAGLGRVRRWTSITLRVVIVLLLALALAETRLLWKTDRLAVIFLIDRSASVPPEHQSAAFEFARIASRYRDREKADHVGAIVFGRTGGIEAIPRPRELFEDKESFDVIIERDVTDIQSAVRLAMAAFPEGYGRRIVLVTDGNENRGHVLEEARAAADDGVTIDVLSVRYSYPGEILIDKVAVDPEIHVGEPFDVRVIVESTRETEATLRVFENGSHISSETVALQPGKNVFTVPRRVDTATAHTFHYEVLVEPLDREHDAVIQNNIAHAFTFIRGLPRVLLATDDEGLDRALIGALRDERIIVDVIGPESLSSDPGAYLRYAAILFSNIGAHHLSQEKMRLLESLVKGAGIGFVMIGGEQSFGAGGYLGSPIEAMLPVYMDVKQKKTLPNGALAVIMHSCEIGNGNYWAKATVQEAIRVLSPQDYCGVLYYGGMGGESWLFPMLPCTKRGYMLNRLMGFNVGDMPDFARIFDMAHKGLDKTPAALKHIIVFSDGDPNMPSDAQLAAIRNSNITISAICMGFHTTPANMQKLAQKGGGNYYSLTGPDNLPEIFIREAITVRKALIQELDFQPIVHRGGSFLAGIDLAGLPPLHGYVITSEKEAADHFLKAPPAEGDLVMDPVLSSWHYGVGKSVAFTSDSGRKWASDWGDWGSYRQFWGQLVRWVSKRQTDDRFRITQQRDGDVVSVFIDALDTDGRFINDIPFDANVVTPGPDFESIPAEVRQVAPGRYRMDFDVGKEGNYLVSLKYAIDGEERIYTTGLVNPYSAEYRNMATNDALLERIAGATGGAVLDGLEGDAERSQAVFRRDFPTSRTPQDLWRSLLHIAAALFFLDVFVRRVIVDWAKLYRTAQGFVLAAVRRRRVERSLADERLGALLRKKAEVARTQSQPRRFYEAAARPGEERRLDERVVAGADSPAPERRAPSAAAAATAEKKPAPSKEEGYTSRLLAAKRRALKGKDDEG